MKKADLNNKRDRELLEVLALMDDRTPSAYLSKLVRAAAREQGLLGPLPDFQRTEQPTRTVGQLQALP